MGEQAIAVLAASATRRSIAGRCAVARLSVRSQKREDGNWGLEDEIHGGMMFPGRSDEQ